MSKNADSPGPPHLRVAQLIETMSMGGAEHLAVRIANHLAAAGHESHLIVMRGPGVLSARIAAGVHVHYLEFERAPIGQPLRFFSSLRTGFGRLTRVVRQGRIQVLQTHLPGANFLGLLVAWRRGCAVIPTVHNNQEFNYGDTDNRVRQALRKWAYRRMLQAAWGMIAVSADVRDSLVAELGVAGSAAARIHVSPNAVAIPAPLAEARIAGIRRSFGLGDGETFLLSAGRFCAQKNFQDLVAAAALLRESGLAFRLVIAGEGEARAPLSRRVAELGLEDRVSLPGNLTDLDEVMQAADVFVMSSLWEGLPLVLLEAMAAALPTVAYGIPGVTELVRDGRSGLLAAVGDPRGLADHLSALIDDDDLRQACGAAGKAEIRSRFDFSDYMDTLVGHYVAASRSSTRGAI